MLISDIPFIFLSLASSKRNKRSNVRPLPSLFRAFVKKLMSEKYYSTLQIFRPYPSFCTALHQQLIINSNHSTLQFVLPYLHFFQPFIIHYKSYGLSFHYFCTLHPRWNSRPSIYFPPFSCRLSHLCTIIVSEWSLLSYQSIILY